MKQLLLLICILYPFVCSIGQEINYEDLIIKDGMFYEKNSNIAYTGKIIRNYSSYMFLEVDCVDGIFNGAYRNWFAKGILHKEGQLVNGKFENLVKEYYESGELYIVENYMNGKLEGLLKNYYKSGILRSEIQYKNGIALFMKSYDEEGKLKYEAQYKNGIIQFEKSYE